MKCTYYKVMQYRLMDGKRMYAGCAGTVDGPLRNARKAISALRKEQSRGDCAFCPMWNVHAKHCNHGRTPCFAKWLYATEDVFSKKRKKTMKKLSESDISPTPWKQGYSDGLVFDSQGNIVADVRSRDDARLCAAAPDLYEALREIYEDFEPMCECECHGCKHEPGCNKWAIKARAALEKAGGREMNDKRFMNAMKGIPRVRVVDESGNIVIDNAYYWVIPATTFCFKHDYERDGYGLIEGVVTFDQSDWGLTNRPRFVRVTPPHRIELMDDEVKEGARQ